MKTGPQKPISPIVIRSEDQLANALRRLRKIQGLSQVELAKKAGVTQPTVSRLEKGSKAAAIGTLFLVFSALGVDLFVALRAPTNRTTSLEGIV